MCYLKYDTSDVLHTERLTTSTHSVGWEDDTNVRVCSEVDTLTTLDTKAYSHAIDVAIRKLPSLRGCETITNLRQDDFSHGTYRIKTAGCYRLAEDIEFQPNCQCDVHRPSTSGGSETEHCWEPYDEDRGCTLTPTRAQRQAGGGYDEPAWKLGFFAAVTIEADDVLLDLNGYTLQQSPRHHARQRFFANVELGAAPFAFVHGAPTGPANFGRPSLAPNRVKISGCAGDGNGGDATGRGPGCSVPSGSGSADDGHDPLGAHGTLGRSSHHGIHGNDARTVLVERLRIEDYEVAAVSLNGGHYTVVRQVETSTADRLPFNSLLSQSIFALDEVRAKLFCAHASNAGHADCSSLGAGTASADAAWDEEHVQTVNDLYSHLKADVQNAVEASVGIARCAAGLDAGTDAQTFINTCVAMPTDQVQVPEHMRSLDGLSDANVYGIVLNKRGVAVNKFAHEEFGGDEVSFVAPENTNNVVQNVAVRRLSSSPREVIGLTCGVKAMGDKKIWGRIMGPPSKGGTGGHFTSAAKKDRAYWKDANDADALADRCLDAAELGRTNIWRTQVVGRLGLQDSEALRRAVFEGVDMNDDGCIDVGEAKLLRKRGECGHNSGSFHAEGMTEKQCMRKLQAEACIRNSGMKIGTYSNSGKTVSDCVKEVQTDIPSLPSRGPFGAVIDVLRILPLPANPSESASPADGVYHKDSSHSLFDSQLLLAELATGLEGTAVCPRLLEWRDSGKPLSNFMAESRWYTEMKFVRGGDSMAHVMKGNIGIFISGGRGVVVDRIKLMGLHSHVGANQDGTWGTASDVNDKLGADHQVRLLNVNGETHQASAVIGMMVAGAVDVSVSNFSWQPIGTANGDALKVAGVHKIGNEPYKCPYANGGVPV